MENIRQAVAADHTQRRLVGQIDTIREKLGSLTRREHAVLMEVVSGGTNKIIAHKLNLSQRTIEIHRFRLMEKISTGSVAQLVRMLMSVEHLKQGAPPDC